ncbi:protein PBDC1 [Parasteatoda tepidariorum]|uniref:protein PBDC1 n=1 Tax=Parasteatoda tepidariorum TaxID=114398 RepID=UPI00077FCE26|nr:protein PBDC1 [Parasteatoda tepidariorum]XP_015920553.1 protein PBDC1 [Parasteatoda tepidariorum]
MVEVAPEKDIASSLFDAENYDNDPQIALAWAGTAVEHMEIHFNLITSVPTEKLKLTNCDDELYEAFLKEFPDFKLDVISAESLDSKENKQKWREFIERFSDKVEDAKFGTLVRLDSTGEYTEENTKLVLRVQFLAIEIARNRKGLNEIARKKYGKTS